MTWQPINLAGLPDRPTVEPTVGGLLYPGKRHVFSGPPESGKTLVAYALALQVIRDGGSVLVLDYEMGQWDARDRLREMGASDSELGRVLFVEPDSPADDQIIEALIGHDPSLVIIDSAAGAYDLQSLDDNKRGDVEKFTRLYVRSFWQHDIATVVLDHVVKNADSRGGFAIGSERKVGGVDVHLGFAAMPKLSRGGHGLYKLTTHKDRSGFLRRGHLADVEFRSDPHTHALTWTIRPAADSDHDDGFRPTVLMERVSRHVEQYPEGISRTAVYRDVKGKTEGKVAAVNCLVRDGYLDDDGSRLFPSKPFRDVPAVSLGSQAFPDPFPAPGSSSVPSVPSSIGGNEERRNQPFPLPGDDHYLTHVYSAFENGHLTESEWRQADRAHRLVRRAR